MIVSYNIKEIFTNKNSHIKVYAIDYTKVQTKVYTNVQTIV